jgi:hypothetical protein
MPWEDMRSNLPPWVRGLSKGESFEDLARREFDTFSPERWVKHFIRAGQEGLDAGAGAVDGAADLVGGVPAEPVNNGGRVNGDLLMEGTSLDQGPAEAPKRIDLVSGGVSGLDLGPVLEGSMTDLNRVLAGE